LECSTSYGLWATLLLQLSTPTYFYIFLFQSREKPTGCIFFMEASKHTFTFLTTLFNTQVNVTLCRVINNYFLECLCSRQIDWN
jgi:hypothetical protein